MTKSTLFGVLGFFSLWSLACAAGPPAVPQQLPAAATSGGAWPRLAQSNLPEQSAPMQMTVPPVIERPLDPGAGPRVVVSSFEIRIDGQPAQAWRGGAFVNDLRMLFETKRRQQSPGGFTIGELEAITVEATDWLRSQGLLVGRVYLPVQSIRNGKVVVQVMQGRLGSVSPEGNRMYNSARLTRPFEELQGLPVDRKTIDRALREISGYPGLVATGVFEAGEELGTTALTLQVRDEQRFETVANIDNHGSEFTGEYRGNLSVRANNVTGRADVLDFNLLGTSDPANAQYGGISYMVPQGPDRKWTFGYRRNEFDVGQQFGGEVAGTTDIYGIGFQQSLIRAGDGNVALGAGLARKTAEIEGGQSIDELAVVSIGIDFDFVDRRRSGVARGLNQGSMVFMHGFPDFLGSMDKIGDSTGDGSPDSSRRSPFPAGGDFDKFYLNYSRLQRVNDNFTILLRLSGQISDDVIVSLEQFSLGGPSSVRAYAPSEFLVDTGGFASAEFIVGAPGFANRPAFNNRRWGEVLQLSLFYDYAGGYLSDFAPSLGEEKTHDLRGGGIGLRFSPSDHINVRLEAAWPDSSVNPSNERDPQFYFSLNFPY